MADLLTEFQRFLDICAEGGRNGRPMDLIPKADWERALAAVRAPAQDASREAMLECKRIAVRVRERLSAEGDELMQQSHHKHASQRYGQATGADEVVDQIDAAIRAAAGAGVNAEGRKRERRC